ncbi:motility associated factor glycosyltransferase family protein [Clostridium tyrobutyricum]|uniref:motility associated factor glycosyltransferase family protein n=1 Tax=Clostridium tyrobutyricum TaxID=1519 RepID=UPI00189C5D08|nr:6-hydroxymethylpterin diphosphokinase MptE-like protein [Clostridium tyrobutyricum]
MKNLTNYLRGVLDNESVKDNEVELEKSRDGKCIFKVNYDGKFKYIGSRYSVKRDIDNFLFKVGNIEIDSLIIVFGLGTGEHILSLIDKLKEFNKLLIVEPDKRILKSFLKLTYAETILKDKKISIIVFEEYNIRYYINNFIKHESNYNNTRLICYSNYDKLYPKEYLYFLNSLKNVLSVYEGNVITGYVLGKKFMQCYLDNIKSIYSSYIVNDFKSKFNGYTAIIVSAGPSLEKNIDELKNLNDNAIIICGNRTLKPLLERGIIPHFMCAVDCNDIVYDMCKDYLKSKIPLVFLETTNSKLVINQKGYRIFSKYAYLKSTSIEKIFEKKIDSLYTGGSVAHISMDFARYIGCTSIIFIGQDLAYTDNKVHADTAEIAEDNKKIDDKSLIQVDGINGGKVYTIRSLGRFIDAFEEYINYVGDSIKFINATEGGAFIKGTEVSTLKDAISKYAVKSGVKNIMDNLFKEKPQRDPTKIYEYLKFILRGLIDLKNRIEIVKDNVISAMVTCKLSDMKYVYKKISKLNEEIEDNEFLDFIDLLISDVMNKSSVYFRYDESKNETQNLKNMLNAFEKLYRDIIDTIDYVVPKIEIAIHEYKV